jgi:hypothetical protein
MYEHRSGPKQQAAMATEAPGVGRFVLVGCLIGASSALALVGGGLLAAGVDTAGAAGIAGVAAFWGGLGFGGMMGGVAHATKVESASHVDRGRERARS